MLLSISQYPTFVVALAVMVGMILTMALMPILD